MSDVAAKSQKSEAKPHQASPTADTQTEDSYALVNVMQLARAGIPPPHKPGTILQLQRLIGNQAVQRFLAGTSSRNLIQRDVECRPRTIIAEPYTFTIPLDTDYPTFRRIICEHPVVSRRLLYRTDGGAHAEEILLNHSNLEVTHAEIQRRLIHGEVTMAFAYHMEPTADTDGNPETCEERVESIEITDLEAPDTRTEEFEDDTVEGRTPLPRPLSAAETMRQAMAVFRASASGQTEQGQAIATQMAALVGSGEVAYEIIDNSDLYGGHREGSGAVGAADVFINAQYSLNIAITALTLAHEVTHSLIDESYILEEIQTHRVEIRLYRDLRSGVEVDGQLFQIPEGYNEELETASEMEADGQLVDYLIANYHTQADFTPTPNWIHHYLDDWGGPANRSPFTLAYYLGILTRSDSPSQEQIDDIMTILEHMQPQYFHDSVRDHLGGGDYDDGRERLRNALRSAWSSSRSRLEAIEQRFNVVLH